MVLGMIGEAETRIWEYLLENRQATAQEVVLHCGVTFQEAEGCMGRISSANWRKAMAPRDYNIGESDYGTRKIQPWDIWLEYDLNPWDADIVKRVLRTKAGQRVLDYEKIKHICDERIRQLVEEKMNEDI